MKIELFSGYRETSLFLSRLMRMQKKPSKASESQWEKETHLPSKVTEKARVEKVRERVKERARAKAEREKANLRVELDQADGHMNYRVVADRLYREHFPQRAKDQDMKNPKRLSASKMKSYQMCAFKYYLSYGLFAQGKPSFAAELGTELHWIYEMYAQAVLNGKDEDGRTCEDIEKNWKNLLQKRAYAGLESWQWCRHVQKVEKSCDTCPAFKDGVCNLVEKDIDSFDGCPWNSWVEAQSMVGRVLSATGPAGIFVEDKKIVGTEDRFEIEFEAPDGETVMLNGLIDMVVELDEDTLEIIDYKTGRFKMSYNVAEKDLQLRLYYLAVKRKYPQYKNHMVTIMYVNEGIKTITPAFGDKTEDDLLVEIGELYSEISEDSFPSRIRDTAYGDKPNHICKYMCSAKMCEDVYEKLGRKMDADPSLTIDSFGSLDDLDLNEEDYK